MPLLTYYTELKFITPTQSTAIPHNSHAINPTLSYSSVGSVFIDTVNCVVISQAVVQLHWLR